MPMHKSIFVYFDKIISLYFSFRGIFRNISRFEKAKVNDKITAPKTSVIISNIVSVRPVSIYPSRRILSINTFLIFVISLFFKREEHSEVIYISFCISVLKKQSAPNSKNSQKTDIAAEKHIAKITRSQIDAFFEPFSRLGIYSPTIAKTTPPEKCKSLSQQGISS